MKTFVASVASASSYELAEGPVWDAEHGRAMWVDIPAGTVMSGELLSGSVDVSNERRFPGPVASVVPTADDGLLVTFRRGFTTVASDGMRRIGRSALPETDDSRFNDGACDPVGRFLVGGMALDDSEGTERRYRVDDAGAV